MGNGNTTIDNDANLGRTPTKKRMMIKKTYKKIPKMAMTMTTTKKKRPTTKPKMKKIYSKIEVKGTPGTFQTGGNEARSMTPEITGGKTIDINKVNKDRRKK